MEALSDHHSRRLFFKRIFGSDDHCPDVLNEVSKEILKKCGGLPLAIISISGLLASRSATKEDWEKVKRSIGSALENKNSLDGMNSILFLGYNDLPPNLKTCLLYLSVFPEDYVIRRDRLVRRWIAEGIISQVRGQSLEEVAENYFYELINKSMVQPVGIGYDGKVHACRVHDMMLEILISKSAEDNFVTVVGGGQTSLKKFHGFIRRLSVQHIDRELASSLANEDLSHVRSLTVTSSGSMKHFPSLAKFEALRVLDFEHCHGLNEYDINNMDKLFQLKYLSLRNTDISKLQLRIELLHDLDTLDIKGTSTVELPAGIILLKKLQCLHTGVYCKVPKGIGNMKSLRVISYFRIEESSLDAVEELGNLTRLNELYVILGSGDEYKRHEEMLISSLCKLSSYKLQSLTIDRNSGSLNFIDSWSPPPSSLQYFRMGGHIYLAKIPKWISPGLTSLALMDINLTELSEEGLHTLGELPSLLVLHIYMDTAQTEQLTIIGFPYLKEFRLKSQDGPYITLVKGPMANLEKLELIFDMSVAKPHGSYLGIEHLPCLKVIEVWDRSGRAITSECKAALAAIKNGAGVHPNHPKVTIFANLEEKDNDETSNDGGKSKEEGN